MREARARAEEREFAAATSQAVSSAARRVAEEATDGARRAAQQEAGKMRESDSERHQAQSGEKGRSE